ncbi:MAG: hypothetical protein HZA90_22200 [Verrucomicrobia bacterium]|nr:hypothetical protein [Verrucomicrobiota bacterium]
MNDPLHQWLAERAQTPGVQACGLRYPDHTTVTHSTAPNFPPDALENAWRCVADTFQVLKHHRLPAVHLRWVFEHALLYCLTRPDGVCLTVFTSRKAQEVDAAALQAMFTEFQDAGR